MSASDPEHRSSSASQSLSELTTGPAPTQWELIGRLWQDQVRRYLPILVIALVLMLVEGASLGAFAWLIQPLFDGLFADDTMDGVAWIAALIAGLFVLRAATGFVQRMLVVSVGLRVSNNLQREMVAHMLTLDQRFFQDNSPGALIERVRGDTLALRRLASNTLISVGRDSFTLLSLVTVMLFNDWVWTLTALVGIPLLIVPLFVLFRFIRSTSHETRTVAGRLTVRLDEIFHGIQTIKLNRLEQSEDTRFAKELKRFLRPSLRAQAGVAANPASMDLLAAVGFVMVLWFGGQQIVAGDKTIGEFLSFFTALGLMFEPMRRLSNAAGNIQVGLASVERIYTVLDNEPTIRPPDAPEPMPQGDIRFDNVVFGYDETPVLHGLSFTAEEGKTTALVGPSGAGKSTVFALITRLADAGSGAVTIGTVPVPRIGFDALRTGIAVVAQDSALFDESIATNIRMGRLDATDDEVRQAAQQASVTEFADALPDGLNTMVGPRGSALSGGQKQRVTIARAILKSAPVLLLDEPTSALDAASEQLVQDAFDQLAEGRTTLVIAHRLSTIRNADKIVVMEEGRVVEEGRHAALLAKGGAYARLHALQSAGAKASGDDVAETA